MWPGGMGSYNKLFQRQNPALVAENQICIFLELGEKVDSGISLYMFDQESGFSMGYFFFIYTLVRT